MSVLVTQNHDYSTQKKIMNVWLLSAFDGRHLYTKCRPIEYTNLLSQYLFSYLHNCDTKLTEDLSDKYWILQLS